MRKLLLIFIFAVISLIAPASITNTFLYSRLKLNTVEISEAGDTVSTLSYEGLENGGDIGKPSVPIQVVRFSVPFNAVNFTLSTDTGLKRSITLSHPVKKITGETAITSSETLTPNFPPIISPAFEMHENAVISNIGYAGGIHKIVTVTLFPIKVSTDRKTISLTSKISLTLDWEISSNLNQEGLCPITSNNIGCNTKHLESLQCIVENKDDLLDNAYQIPAANNLDNEVWEYIIVAPSRLCDALEPLAAMRRSKGYSAKVFSIETILSDPRFAAGDTISGINDDAGKLRAFITEAYSNNGVQNVLLAGIFPDIPIRYGHTYNPTNHTTQEDSCKFAIPSDLYFSELNGSWNTKLNSTGVYGLPTSYLQTDNKKYFDYYSEVSIGRIPFKTVEDVNNYIEKLKTYEFNPGLGDLSYLNNVFVSRQGKEIAQQFNDNCISSLLNRENINITLIDDIAHHSTGAEIIASLNSNPSVHHNFIGHGNPGGVAVSYNNNGGNNGILALSGNHWWHTPEAMNGLNNLENKAYPGWSYSTSCTLMPFDIYKYPTGYSRQYREYDYPWTFGESYLLGKNYGGVALLGNTRPSYMDNGRKAMKFFYDNLPNTEEASYALAGVTMNYVKSYADIRHDERLMHNLYGDPLVPLWTKAPKTISYRHQFDENPGGYRTSIQGLENIADFTLGVQDLWDPTMAYKLNTTSDYFDDFKQEANKIYTIYSPNCLPLILPCYLQSLDVYEGYNRTIFGGEVYCGMYNPEITQHGVSIKPNSKLTISAIGNVSIDKHVSVENSATLKIVCDKNVYLNGLTVTEGAVIDIKADSIFIDNSINLSTGIAIFRLDGKIVHKSPRSIKKYKSSYQPLVVEGRTWWYKSTMQGDNTNGSNRVETAEYGLQIGDSVEFNGKQWHKVNIVDCRYIYSDGTTERFSPNSQIALIREEGGNVYSSVINQNSWDDRHQVLREYMFGPFYAGYPSAAQSDTECLVYSFSPDNATVHYGYTDSKYVFNVDSITEESFNKYSASKIWANINISETERTAPVSYGFSTDSSFRYLQGIGVVECNKFGVAELFFMPFGFCQHACFPIFNPPLLQYVTEDNDNRIIYTERNGDKIWMNAGLSTLESDNNSHSEVYGIDGIRVNGHLRPGLYIRRNGQHSEKVLIN